MGKRRQLKWYEDPLVSACLMVILLYGGGGAFAWLLLWLFPPAGAR